MPIPKQVTVEQARRHLDYKIQNYFSAFIKYAFHVVNPGTPFENNWHLDLICDYLDACERREIKRLVINLPPRSLKSLIISVAWPAWLLAKNPGLRILTTSYSKDLSGTHSQECRLIMEDERYRRLFPATKMSHDQNTKSKFVTTARGHRIATSTGSKLSTGFGGNFLIADDLHSAMDALSDVKRKQQLNWFDKSFTSRLDNKKQDVIVVVMQRLHEDDLTGHLLQNGGWDLLKIPVLAEKKTLFYDIAGKHYEFKKGTLLHEARMGAKEIEQERRSLRASFDGQYMQEPVPDGGGIFRSDWFKLWPAKKPDGSPNPFPRLSYVLQSYDTAFTQKTSGDCSACTVWGVFNLAPDEKSKPEYAIILLDCWAEHLSFPELKSRAMSEFQGTYGVNDKRVDRILIEKKGSGQSLIQELQLTELPIHAYDPGHIDKVARAHMVTHIVESGKVFLPESETYPGEAKTWIQPFLQEVCAFPVAMHDDYVDSMTQALAFLEHAQFIEMPTVKYASDPDLEPVDYAEDFAVNPYDC